MFRFIVVLFLALTMLGSIAYGQGLEKSVYQNTGETDAIHRVQAAILIHLANKDGGRVPRGILAVARESFDRMYKELAEIFAARSDVKSLSATHTAWQGGSTYLNKLEEAIRHLK